MASDFKDLIERVRQVSSANRKWTDPLRRAAILRRLEAGLSLSAVMVQQEDRALHEAVSAGSGWYAGLERLGFDPSLWVRNRKSLTREQVLQQIAGYAASPDHDDLFERPSKLDRHLYFNALREFGTWQAALEQAGVS